MKLLIKFLKPYMSVVHVRIIERLLADNDRLNKEWKQRYWQMEREMWHYKDLYMDMFLNPPEPKS